MRKTNGAIVCLLAGWFALLPIRVGAQSDWPRLDAQSSASISRLLQLAESERLPLTSLRAKVDEGLGKGASGEVIVRVATAWLTALRDARAALGPSDTVDLDAGAAALRAGAEPSLLRNIRMRRQPGRAAIPLVVYVDLVRRGVPTAVARDGMLDLLGDGATDGELLAMRSQLAQQGERGDDIQTAFRTFLRARPNREPEGGTPGRPVDGRLPIPRDSAMHRSAGTGGSSAAMLMGTAGDSTRVGVALDHAAKVGSFRLGAHFSASTGGGERVAGELSGRINPSAGWTMGVEALRMAEVGLRGGAMLGGWLRRGPVMLTGGLERTSEINPALTGRLTLGRDTLPTGSDTLPGSSSAVGPQATHKAYNAVIAAEGTFRSVNWRAQLTQPLKSEFGRTRWDGRLERAVTPSVSVIAVAGTGGRRPGMLATRQGLYTGIGMAVRRRSSSVDPEPVPAPVNSLVLDARGARESVLSIVDPAAQSVEIRGSFSGWRLHAMVRDAAGRWSVSVAIAPGLHQVSIRRDGGAWTAPPGLPVGVGEYGDEVGVLVVR